MPVELRLVVAIVVVAAAVFVMVLAGRGKEGGRQGGDVRACYRYQLLYHFCRFPLGLI